jgi:uncharacterized protein YecE (DUF72 family)
MPSQPPQPTATTSRLCIGTAGWSIPRHHAESFPGEGSHLQRYSASLPCTEINSTFYRPPRASTWVRWAESVPPTFRFSVKAPRAITHDSALAPDRDPLTAFLAEISALGDKLGPILFQLPPKLEFDPARAEAFFHLFRSLYPGPAALEPRNRSWFTPEADLLLRQLQIARVAADPAVTPEAAGPGGDPRLLYIRLHGSPHTYRSDYTAEALSATASIIRRHSEATERWCIFDNTTLGHAAGNALSLLHQLET